MYTDMVTRCTMLRTSLSIGSAFILGSATSLAQDQMERSNDDRQQWLGWVGRVASLVLTMLDKQELRMKMPVEAVAGQQTARSVGTHLEAMARLLAGLAPWLELEDPSDKPHKIALRVSFRQSAQQAIASVLNPVSPDYMGFGESSQTLVDSSFLALALLRAPKVLLSFMESETRSRMITALQKERSILPPFSNWLLLPL
ncbi:MAG: DUF2264 domain-containing protein [Janthinobacterium lividum]